MIRLVSLLVVLSVLVGCDSSTRENRVSGPTPQPPPLGPVNGVIQPVNGVIQVGEDLKGTFSGPWLFYELTAPSDGTLVLRLSWNPATATKLMVAVGNMEFKASPPDWSPVVGRVPVAAGQTYLLKIDQAYAPWDYDFSITPFVLTTALE